MDTTGIQHPKFRWAMVHTGHRTMEAPKKHQVIPVIFHFCCEAWDSLWASKLHPCWVPISLKIELYIFPVERTAFCFGQCFSYCLYLNILIIQAHGYTQPSQPLLIFTSSATVSGDPAGVIKLNKRKQKPTIRTWKPTHESKSFRGIRLQLSRHARLSSVLSLLTSFVWCNAELS